MYQYEEFYLSKYFAITEETYYKLALDQKETPIEAAERKATRFMEATCSAVYGYCEEVHHFEKLNKPIKLLPSAYGNGLLYPFLKDLKNLDPDVLKTLAKTFHGSKKESGFFNYFMNVPDISRDLFPEDIDDTSLFLMGLYSQGEVSFEECCKTGRKMLKLFKQNEFLGPNRELGTWLPKEPGSSQDFIILRKLLNPPRIDLGSTLNFLLFLTKFGLDDDECLNGALEYIGKYVDLQHKSYNDDNFPGLSYYTNHHIIYLLLSRYLEANQKARCLFGAKVSEIVINCLTLFSKQDNPHALDLACVILAAFKLKLYDEADYLETEGLEITDYTIGQNNCDWKTNINANGLVKSENPLNSELSNPIRELLTSLVNKLLTLQSVDGSFPPWNAFRWDKQGHYGGSKALTTGFCVSAIANARKLNLV